MTSRRLAVEITGLGSSSEVSAFCGFLFFSEVVLQLIVFGMHRSGTSAITGLLQAMGAFLGEECELLAPMECNIDGFRERQDVHDINEHLLAALDASWYAPLNAESNKLPVAEQESFTGSAAPVIEKLNRHHLWALKDPRMCVLYPYWKPLLSDPIGVLCWRNPLEVAASLQRRDGLPFVYGLALWEWYTVKALEALQDMPFCVVSYDRLIDKPLDTALELYQSCLKCGVSGLREPNDEMLASVIKPGLRHEAADRAIEDDWLSRNQLNLINWLRNPAGAPPIHGSDAARSVLEVIGDLRQRLDSAERRICAVEQCCRAANEGRERWEKRAETVMRSADALSDASDVLLRSLSWKIGRTAGTFARLVQGGKAGSSPESFLQRAAAEYRDWKRHRDFRVIALINTYNEELLIRPCIEHLISHGIDIFILDNESTDRTVEIALEYKGRGLIAVENVPRNTDAFCMLPILARKEELTAELDADWFMHTDSDEFRYPPAGFSTLKEAIVAADARGYNAIEFMEYTFVATAEHPRHLPGSFLETMRWYYPFQPFRPHRLNAWKRQSVPVSLAEFGGHQVNFPGRRIYPEYFVLRHYTYLSEEHAVAKFAKLKPVIAEAGYHGFRKKLIAADIALPSENDLRLFDGNASLDASAPRKTRFVEDAMRRRLEGGGK